MFCPRCGNEMTTVDGTFKCLAGDMPLSENMRSQLHEVFIARQRQGRARAFNWGGTWFCPGCSTRMKTDAQHVVCELCGEYLDEFLQALTELHPHLPT